MDTPGDESGFLGGRSSADLFQYGRAFGQFQSDQVVLIRIISNEDPNIVSDDHGGGRIALGGFTETEIAFDFNKWEADYQIRKDNPDVWPGVQNHGSKRPFDIHCLIGIVDL